ncbi:ATP-binding protein [Bacillus sp. V5-8f]|uniref:ATP-binding protein n=1 Tax=Bacillus sp. V5-8f TaxID=2053044 RepID=UPI000C78573B|nr:ATP-binding protein [Bacillus sp. V5-8f]PLT35117.1 hypothetical protein CUU64_06980 [Bacillus sp. V5-8f]
MFGIQEFLLNMLFIILSIFAYQIFWADHINRIKIMTVKRNQFIITLLCSCSLLLCIAFPVSQSTGYFYDLRQIPILIGTFYGGAWIGLVLTGIMVVYRFFLGGSGVLNTILFYSAFISIVISVRPLFLRYNLRNKLFLVSIIVASMSFFPIILAQHIGFAPKTSNLFILIFCGVSLFTVCLSIYLIERLLEIVRLRIEVHHAEKMNVLGELTASIAHEIRSPMTASRGFMQLLKEEISNERNQSYIDLAISEMDRAQSTISDYISFARPEVEELEKIDISALVSNLLSMMSPYAAFHNVKLVSNVTPNIFINGSTEKLTQSLVNILKNGIEASTGKGKVEITTISKEKTMLLKICDNGIGMKEEQMQRLGTPFYSTKEKGTGLSLSLSYRLIEMMDGTIKVESEPGKGTSFNILFPFTTDDKSP